MTINVKKHTEIFVMSLGKQELYYIILYYIVLYYIILYYIHIIYIYWCKTILLTKTAIIKGQIHYF